MNVKPITVAGCRLKITLDIDQNLIEIKKAIDWANEQSVEILSTPECALSGYLWEPESWDDPRIKKIHDGVEDLKQYSKDKNVDLILGTAAFDKEKNWINCQKFILGGKELFEYSKNQLTELDVRFYHQRNYLPPLLNYKGHMISSLVCNDYWAPVIKHPEHGELLRFIRDSNVKILFLGAYQIKEAGPDQLYYKWSEANLQMNSFLGNFYTVCSDTTTKTDGEIYQGDPCAPVGIVDTDGQWVIRGSDQEISYFKHVVY